MAYGLRYQGVMKNELQQMVTVKLMQKDYVGDPENFIFTADSSVVLTDTSDENTIIAREAAMNIWADKASSITWQTFLAGAYDEWQCIIDIDGILVFEGYLTPEEGSSPFLPKPYEVNLKATNGLKLIKDVPFTGLAGETIKGKYLLSDLLCAALLKTGLSLNVRIYGSVYNEDMDNRADDIAATYWNQTKEDHRTFLSNATEFLSCYDVLKKLLERHSRLFYFKGMWVVFLTAEAQYAPGGLYYTDFTSAGVVIGGAEDTEAVATVGSAEPIFPINEDALISSLFAIKFAKTNYKYNVWPEIPLNNKFQRGTLFNTGSGVDDDGNPYNFEDYEIDDWQKAMVDITVTPPNFTFDPVEGALFLRRVYNIYGIELRREIFFETPTTASPGGSYVKWLIAERLPVNQGDKIKIGMSVKFDNDFTGAGDGFVVMARVYLIPDTGTDYYALDNNVGGRETSFGLWVKESGTPPNFISVDLPADSDSTKYKNQTVTSDTIPANGTLYIALQHSNDGSNPGGNKWFSAFEFEYIPFIAGGYIPIEGDYWQHTQNANQLDKDEADIQVSDTIIRVLQGCFFNLDGLTATTPTWYRYGLTESRHFKELVNLDRFNLGYRRFQRIEGTFVGLLYSPGQPMSYHKNYLFTGLTVPAQFILAPGMSMDLGTGEIKATFEEVLTPSLTQNIGARMDQVIAALIDLIAATTETDWDAASLAPAPGTDGFPPVLSTQPPDRRVMEMIVNTGENVTASANDNGVGNAPALTVNTQTDAGGVRSVIITIGEDIAVGNIYSFTIYGVTVSYEVVDLIVQSDGTQLSDDQVFNYIFSRTSV